MFWGLWAKLLGTSPQLMATSFQILGSSAFPAAGVLAEATGESSLWAQGPPQRAQETFTMSFPSAFANPPLGSLCTCSCICTQQSPCSHQWGHFPFPREKGSEKGSAQSVAGVGMKPDFLQKSG